MYDIYVQVSLIYHPVYSLDAGQSLIQSIELCKRPPMKYIDLLRNNLVNMPRHS
jgi:hypothetical protein